MGGIMNDKGKKKWGRKWVGLGWIDLVEEGEVWKGVVDGVEK